MTWRVLMKVEPSLVSAFVASEINAPHFKVGEILFV